MASRKTASRTPEASTFPLGEGGLRPDPNLLRGMSCPQCAGQRVTRISMRLTDGSPVDFLSCQDCEHKHWRGADGALGLERVLDHARKPR